MNSIRMPYLPLALALGFAAFALQAPAETIITTFSDGFELNSYYAAWGTVDIAPGDTNFSITATGYGSGYKDINPNLDASGETKIQLTVTLSSPTAGAKDPVSGPIVSLVDADGTFYNYAWYGLTIGRHVLTFPLKAPTSVTAAGTTSGLDLSALDFFHLQDDPGAYKGQYTITFEDLRLTGGKGLAITTKSYNPTTQEFTLTWLSKTGQKYTILHAPDLTTAFAPLQTDLESGGQTTTATVTMPAGEAGFLRIEQQPPQ